MPVEQEQQTVEKRRRLPRRWVGALAAGTVLAVGVGGVTWAASRSSTTLDSSVDSFSSKVSLMGGERDNLGHRDVGKGMMGRGMMGKGMGAALHGEYVVPKKDGGYQTIRMQRGAVTEVSATSITVKSDDGYTKSYAVNTDTLVNAGRDGIATVKSGDTATVIATVSGETATAVQVNDVSLRQSVRQRWG